MVKYRTRIEQHMLLASAARVSHGDNSITMRTISRALDIPYNTVRRYINDEHDNPNFAVVDAIRVWLNTFLSRRDQIDDTGYIYRVNNNGDGVHV